MPGSEDCHERSDIRLFPAPSVKLDALDERPNNTGSMPCALSQERSVGRFSLARWGPGSIAIVMMTLLLGFATMLQWWSTKSGALLAVGVLSILVACVIFAVKVSETIERAKPWEEHLAGKVGTVVTQIDGNLPGVVKVGGSTWSARTNGAVIGDGERVVVTSVDGLYLVVQRMEEGPADDKGAVAARTRLPTSP